MIANAILPLLPLVVLGAGALLLVLIAAFWRKPKALAVLATVPPVVALLTAGRLFIDPPGQVGTLFLVDRYALFFVMLLNACTCAVVLLTSAYEGQASAARAEVFPLTIFAALGAAAIVCSSHFLSFFVGLEILSVSLYPLIAYQRSPRALEAGFKYLVLSAAAAAALLFGIALLYFHTGTLFIPHVLAGHSEASAWRYGAAALVFAGVGFKLALTPFHMWAPDVYQGAEAPSSAFIASVSKGALFAFLLRYLAIAQADAPEGYTTVITIIAIGSILIGNLLALRQENLKRLLAYSSIGQAGYVLVALRAGGPFAIHAAAFFLTAYFASVLAAFGVIAISTHAGKEPELIADYEGLAWRAPWRATVLAAAMLSMGGIPLTAGFLGKFYLLSAGVRTDLWLLVLTLLVGSVIGLYYYLRVIIALVREPEQLNLETAPVPISGVTVLWALGLVIAALGLYPTPLIRLITAIAA